MARIAFTTACICILLVFGGVSGGPTSPGNIVHETTPDQQEEVHDKLAYIAALTDREHSRFIDKIREQAGTPNKPKTDKEIEFVLREHMLNTTKIIIPELKVLMALTNDREESAKEVNRHFAEDHVKPLLIAILDQADAQDFDHPLIKKISKYAQNQIRLIFEQYNPRRKVAPTS